MLRFLILISLFNLAFSCQPPDCDRKDCGTCANACCTLDYYLEPGPESLNQRLSSLLKINGPDQRYTFVASEDLRPYNISAYFILQGIHTTLVKKYNDTLNFVISPLSNAGKFQSKLRAFSISQIHGAYCDDGQNYKNLIQVVKGLDVDFIETTVAGCKAPEASQSKQSLKDLVQEQSHFKKFNRVLNRLKEIKKF